GLRLGEREGDTLEGAHRSVKGDPGGDVLPRLLEGDLRGAEHLHSDERTGEVEALHHLGETAAQPAQQMLTRHAHTLQGDESTADSAGADVGRAPTLHPVTVQLDEEGADAVATPVLGGAGEDDC